MQLFSLPSVQRARLLWRCEPMSMSTCDSARSSELGLGLLLVSR